jgi:hypothetical protein
MALPCRPRAGLLCRPQALQPEWFRLAQLAAIQEALSYRPLPAQFYRLDSALFYRSQRAELAPIHSAWFYRPHFAQSYRPQAAEVEY